MPPYRCAGSFRHSRNTVGLDNHIHQVKRPFVRIEAKEGCWEHVFKVESLPSTRVPVARRSL